MLKNCFKLLFISFLVLSCTTDIEPIDPGLDPALTAVKFTADIDGVFTDLSDEVMAELSADGLGVGTDEEPILVIQVFNPAVGSFNVDANNTNTGAIIGYSPVANSLYVPASGTVTITSFDTVNMLVTGTFNGIMSDFAGVDPDVIITNGVFQNVPFTEGIPTDMGSADVDGVAFVADFFASGEIGNQVSINLSNSLNEVIVITFPLNITPGTYPFDSFMGSGGFDYLGSYTNDNLNNGDSYYSQAGSGDLVITDVTNGIVTGTFNFTAEEPNTGDTVVVTNGMFVFDIN